MSRLRLGWRLRRGLQGWLRGLDVAGPGAIGAGFGQKNLQPGAVLHPTGVEFCRTVHEQNYVAVVAEAYGLTDGRIEVCDALAGVGGIGSGRAIVLLQHHEDWKLWRG